MLYELLKRDPEGPSASDDEGYLPIEVAADKAYDQPSEVRNLVLDMLQNPANVTRLSGNSKATRQQEQPTWGAPAQTVSGASLVFLCLSVSKEGCYNFECKPDALPYVDCSGVLRPCYCGRTQLPCTSER